MTFVNLNVFLHTTEHAQFRFDTDTLGVGTFDHPLGDGNIFVERRVARVDHDRAVKTGVNAVVARLFVTMVEVHGKNGLGIHGISGADESLKHALVGILAGTFGELDDKGRFAVDASLEQAERLFHIVDIVSTDGVFSVGDFE